MSQRNKLQKTTILFAIVLAATAITIFWNNSRQKEVSQPEEKEHVELSDKVVSTPPQDNKIKNKNNKSQCNNKRKEKIDIDQNKLIPIKQHTPVPNTDKVIPKEGTHKHPPLVHHIPSFSLSNYDKQEVGLFPNFTTTIYKEKYKTLWVASIDRVSKFLIYDSTKIKYVHSLHYPNPSNFKKFDTEKLRSEVKEFQSINALHNKVSEIYKQYQMEFPIVTTTYNNQFVIGKGNSLFYYADEEYDSPNAAIAIQDIWNIPKKLKKDKNTKIISTITFDKSLLVLLSNGSLIELNTNNKIIGSLKLKNTQEYTQNIIKEDNLIVVVSNKGIYEIKKIDTEWKVTNFSAFSIYNDRKRNSEPTIIYQGDKKILVMMVDPDMPKVLFYQIGQRDASFSYFLYTVPFEGDSRNIMTQVVHNNLYLYKTGNAGKLLKLKVDYLNKKVVKQWERDENNFIILHSNKTDRVLAVVKESGKWKVKAISVEDGKVLSYFKLSADQTYIPSSTNIENISPNHFIYSGIMDLIECQIVEP
ncbi:hypothetical protein K4L44_11825 [Halosquirtibacter laminarini]|uniref:Uncharacterized protein n=1 Tax=Halosquirtibacter laminarini TaxID=3374600 RepID=A0AC61NCL0_9BACT|nr:hypothetical protein K4L44_11825 [Prolixibacteraceae bacterium]